MRRSAAGSTARRSTRRRSSAARCRRCRCSTRRSARARAPAISSSTRPTSSPARGSRRTTTFTLDGANNDEGWGRQTMIATVPVGAIQEMTVLSNAFSAEFGWTAGPALNIVTKSGTNDVHGEGLYMGRPGGCRRRRSRPTASARRPSRRCVTPTTLTAINPVDIPDALNQFSGSIGGPIVKDKTFFFATADYTRQDRTTFLSSTLPAFVLPADGNLAYIGQLPPGAVQRAARPQAHAEPDADGASQRRSVLRHNPQDAVGGTSAPSVARRYARRSMDRPGQSHVRCSAPNLLNEARFAYLNGDPVTLLGSADALDRLHPRRVGAVHHRTVARVRTSTATRRSSRTRCRGRAASTTSASAAAWSITPRAAPAASPAPRSLGTFTFLNTTTAPFDQLTLADVQNYTQPINFGISSYELKQWLYRRVRAGQHPRAQRPHARPRAALRPADADRRERRTSRRASASAGIPAAMRAWRFAAATACTTRRFSPTWSPATW